VPGTVALDGAAPKALEDGELQLDDLKPGHHTVRLIGNTGNASFDFEASEKGAPRLSGPPSGNDVMIVTVSTQDGQGQLMSSATGSSVLLDAKDLGIVSASGITLPGLAQADHDLQIKGANDTQRFVLTNIPAPALTVFVKSDVNAGSLVILTGEDGVDVFIDNQKYRRKTEHGQIRIPSLKAGPHTLRVAKQGFLDVPAQTIQIKKSEEARATFHLQPQPQLASLHVSGAGPGTHIFVDGAEIATTGPDGSASASNIKPGDHAIELRRDGFQNKQLQRSFEAGKAIALGEPDVALSPAQPPAETAKQQTTPPAPPEPSQPVPAPEKTQDTQPSLPAQPASMPGAIHKGGGFLIYHTTKAPGHYTFSMQQRKGRGFLKGKRLQWFAGFTDTKNYVLFQVDGKRFTVRQVVDGKSEELQKLSFDSDPEKYVQVEMSVKANSVTTRLRPSDGSWQSMGTATVSGIDLTQGKFGFLIGGNDEVGVSSVQYGK
jgi:cell division septation protein DedD